MITIEDITSQINKDYPYEINSIKAIGDGFGSFVLETDSNRIVRVAKNKDVAKQYLKEYKILPIIRNYFNVKIPEPEWCMTQDNDIPYGMIVYRKIEGQPLKPKMISSSNYSILSDEITSFIVNLHNIPLENINDEFLLYISNRDEVIEIYDETYKYLKEALTRKENLAVDRWWSNIRKDEVFQSYKPALCHGDLWYENVLVDKTCSSLKGIIDFSDMFIGDPARDLATQLYYSNSFYNLILKKYKKKFPEDVHLEERISRHWQLRDLYGLRYSIKYNDEEEFVESIEKIKKGPILREW